jgi:hypothetical protein
MLLGLECSTHDKSRPLTRSSSATRHLFALHQNTHTFCSVNKLCAPSILYLTNSSAFLTFRDTAALAALVPSRPSPPHRSSPHTTLNGSLASRWSCTTAFDRRRYSGRYLGERALQAVPCTSARLAQTVRQAGLHSQLVGELFTLYPRTSLQLQCFSMSVKSVPPSLLPVTPPAEKELVLLLRRTGCPSCPRIQFLSYVEHISGI